MYIWFLWLMHGTGYLRQSCSRYCSSSSHLFLILKMSPAKEDKILPNSSTFLIRRYVPRDTFTPKWSTVKAQTKGQESYGWKAAFIVETFPWVEFQGIKLTYITLVSWVFCVNTFSKFARPIRKLPDGFYKRDNITHLILICGRKVLHTIT